ncbi:uncharacterized protein LOC144181588 [Stigmatopora nigra]
MAAFVFYLTRVPTLTLLAAPRVPRREPGYRSTVKKFTPAVVHHAGKAARGGVRKKKKRRRRSAIRARIHSETPAEAAAKRRRGRRKAPSHPERVHKFIPSYGKDVYFEQPHANSQMADHHKSVTTTWLWKPDYCGEHRFETLSSESRIHPGLICRRLGREEPSVTS